ncbi:MAG: hypothetical protein Tsb0013_23490 [Phycisphaerales bacterium]
MTPHPLHHGARPRPRRGFTLLEVLMSAFVIALGSLGLLALFAGAASQQQASAQLTDSVTFSKNAESVIKTKVENFGSDTRLGCFTPTFEPDYWYALPSHPTYGYVTINPTNEPGESALYVEEFPRTGRGPFPIYRAGVNGAGEVVAGVANVANTALVGAPYNYGAQPLEDELDDRRLLLLAADGNDLEVSFTVYEIGCGTGDALRITNPGQPVAYRFNSDCDDAQDNEVFLGRDGENPDDTDLDHVRVDTQIFPVDGNDPARLVSFRVDEIERPVRQAKMLFNLATETVDGPFPECFDNGDPNVRSVFWIGNAINNGGRPIWSVGNYKDADYISISDPRSGFLTRLAGVSVNDLGRIVNTDLPLARLEIGTRQPAIVPPAERPSGTFLIEKPDFGVGLAAEAREAAFYMNNPSIQFYANDPPTPGLPTTLTLEPLLYPSKIVGEIRINYKRRADELVSLNNRVVFGPDPNYSTGERPNMAYSVLYRDRGGRASDQFLVFTYTLAPSRANAEWFPPEAPDEIENGEAPLRRARGVNLRFERNVERWILIVDENEHGWMTQPGQLLLFAGVGRADGEVEGPGADTIVRVTEVQRASNGTVFLYLDRAPRAAGASLLQIHYPNDDTGEFDVWAIQPDVRSVLDDSIWALDPIEARAFQAGGGS